MKLENSSIGRMRRTEMKERYTLVDVIVMFAIGVLTGLGLAGVIVGVMIGR